MSDYDYDYDQPMEQEDWCEAHYQYDCPICNGGEQDGETEMENILYDAKGKIIIKRKWNKKSLRMLRIPRYSIWYGLKL